jgi:hypothetical protein
MKFYLDQIFHLCLTEFRVLYRFLETAHFPWYEGKELKQVFFYKNCKNNS